MDDVLPDAAASKLVDATVTDDQLATEPVAHSLSSLG